MFWWHFFYFVYLFINWMIYLQLNLKFSHKWKFQMKDLYFFLIPIEIFKNRMGVFFRKLESVSKRKEKKRKFLHSSDLFPLQTNMCLKKPIFTIQNILIFISPLWSFFYVKITNWIRHDKFDFILPFDKLRFASFVNWDVVKTKNTNNFLHEKRKFFEKIIFEFFKSQSRKNR